MSTAKRYQVFVSSTFTDLREERQEVIQALLELECIPSGMELFPAANDDQWTLIKRVIDDCDYYLVVVAGRYGSVASDGLSFTEKEYRYAVEAGKPVMAFLHESPDAIPSGRSEQDPASKQKLTAFRQLCQTKMCKHWSSPADLGGKVSRSLIQLTKNNPTVGWIRGDAALDEGTARTINQLREDKENLEKELERIRREPPKGAELLAQGQEQIVIHFLHSGDILGSKDAEARYTWDRIFAIVAPCMIREGSEYTVRTTLTDAILKHEGIKQSSLKTADIASDTFHQIMVQLRALGLITPSVEKRSVKDRGTRYWSLTPYGDEYMNRLLAIPKGPSVA